MSFSSSDFAKFCVGSGHLLKTQCDAYAEHLKAASHKYNNGECSITLNGDYMKTTDHEALCTLAGGVYDKQTQLCKTYSGGQCGKLQYELSPNPPPPQHMTFANTCMQANNWGNSTPVYCDGMCYVSKEYYDSRRKGPPTMSQCTSEL